MRDLGAALKRAPEGVFFEQERSNMLTQCEQLASKNEALARPSREQPVPPPVVVPETPELSAEHRVIFVKAHEAEAAGEYVAAWNAMKPLFAVYPSSIPVQDVRCRLATQVMSFAAARPECDRIVELSR